ncbi:MAG: ABC transporter ATP-binding protein [Gemmatimonadaceae bacterium]
MICVTALSARYPGARRRALESVSLEALRGEITALAGPNGSGKSTLVRALLRRLPPEEGTITVEGRALESYTRADLAKALAAVPQREEPVFPLTVREYVALGRYVHRGSWTRERESDRRAVAAALDAAALGQLAERSTDALSGGEWQRARIARALAQGSDAIVLDEPTTFLDVAHEMALFELLHALALGGKAVLLVSHELNLVARFAQRIVLLHDGRVAAAGPPGTVMQAAVLERVYEWPLVIARDPAVGAPTLVPLRSARPPEAAG